MSMSQTVHVRIPDEVDAALRGRAKSEGRKVSAMAARILTNVLVPELVEGLQPAVRSVKDRREDAKLADELAKTLPAPVEQPKTGASADKLAAELAEMPKPQSHTYQSQTYTGRCTFCGLLRHQHEGER